MSIVSLPEPFALRMARKAVRESLQNYGEEVIGLQMYHPVIDSGVPRCPVCFDDIYKQGGRADCSACFGTTFQGGIKEMSRMWAMFTTDTMKEQTKKRGVYQPFVYQVQMEYRPIFMENDYLFRVRRWSQDHKPLDVLAAYVMREMRPDTLRTGNQVGQDGSDYIGQRGTVDELPRDHVIYKTLERGIIRPDFTVLRSDGRRR